MPTRKIGAIVTAEELRRMFFYDRKTGDFIRMEASPWKQQTIGRVAGTPDKRGRVSIVIRGRTYFASRLAWLYVHGQWPVSLIDHRDRDPSSNRFDNLREANGSQNQANRVLPRKSKSGAVGVYRRADGKAWFASVGGKYLGSFDTVESASAAYRSAKLAIHGEYARFE